VTRRENLGQGHIILRLNGRVNCLGKAIHADVYEM
jgi:hypothetical protein